MIDTMRRLQQLLGDRYRLDRELGHGGMALVYLAEDLKHHRFVAIKILRPEFAASVGEARFLREIRTIAGLSHPHILPLHDSGAGDGFIYYVMPFVDGDSLRARLKGDRRLSIAEVLEILTQVTEGVAYAHEHGFVHRDLKPENILFQSGQPLVADFGIARAAQAARAMIGSDDDTLTQQGTSLGTPAYMAPEQAAADPLVDHRADLYALGAIAYEMLTGRPPFVHSTPQQVIAAHIYEIPRRVEEISPEVPSSLSALVMRCLEKDPAARPQSAAAIGGELKQIAASESGVSIARDTVAAHKRAFQRALSLYALVLVVIAAVAWTITYRVGLPEWVFSGALVVMALLLPLVLFTGYVHRTGSEMTLPGGTTLTGATTLTSRARPHVTWRRTVIGGVAATGLFSVGVAGFMVMRSLGVGPPGTLFAAGSLEPNERVIVADFKVNGADSSLSLPLAAAARAALQLSAAITVLSPEAIRDALDRMKRPPSQRLDFDVAREIAAREGIKAILQGEVTSIGTGLTVELRLLAAESGRTLAAFSEIAEGQDDLLGVIDHLSRRLRSKVGESLRLVRESPPLARVTTPSLEALRKYTSAVYANNVEGDHPKAAALLREAVALDTGFAIAWRRLSAVYLASEAGTAKSDSAISAAFRHRERLTPLERESITAYYYWQGPGRDRAKAAAAYEALGERNPGLNLTNLGQIYWSRRQFAKAESLNKRVLERNPKGYVAMINFIEALCEQGKFAQTDSMLKAISGWYPKNVAPSEYAARLVYFSGDLESYKRILDSLQNAPTPGSNVFLVWQANLALTRGRLNEYESFWREARARNAVSNAQPPIVDRVVAARIAAEVRDKPVDAIRLLDSAREITRLLPPGQKRYAAISNAYSRAGRPDIARIMLRRHIEELKDTALRRIERPLIDFGLAEIAFAEKKYDAAITLFRRADQAPDGYPLNSCTICLPLDLGQVFDAAGQRDSAIVMYERYIRTPSANRGVNILLDPLNLAVVHERLGHLYEAGGNRSKAAEHYKTFVYLWKNADPELQPRVAQARKRLAAL